jgi:hypothetical protein
MRCRHRLSKLLLRHGIVYCGGQARTGAHQVWLRGQRFEQPGLQVAFEADLEAMLLTLDRRDRLDKAITGMDLGGEYTAMVHRLLVEAAWHHRRTYRSPSAIMRTRW